MDHPRSRWLMPALALLLGLAGCGGGGSGSGPAISIDQPTTAASYATTSTSIRLGGTIDRAAYVHVINTATGYRTDGYVNYLAGQGSWFADVYGLAPGDNLIQVTADADGTGASTASVGITVTLTP